MLDVMQENKKDLFSSYENYMLVTFGLNKKAPDEAEAFYKKHGYEYGQYYKGIEREPFI